MMDALCWCPSHFYPMRREEKRTVYTYISMGALAPIQLLPYKLKKVDLRNLDMSGCPVWGNTVTHKKGTYGLL